MLLSNFSSYRFSFSAALMHGHRETLEQVLYSLTMSGQYASISFLRISDSYWSQDMWMPAWLAVANIRFCPRIVSSIGGSLFLLYKKILLPHILSAIYLSCINLDVNVAFSFWCFQGERNFNRFGGWLGKNSTTGKNFRLLDDLHDHLLASRESNSGR